MAWYRYGGNRAGKQDQSLHLEKKLESGLYCELTDKELKILCGNSTLLYDTILKSYLLMK